MNSRELLERTVLGMALENRYSMVRHIIATKNFKTGLDFKHKSIWGAMETIYPTAPINILSVSNFLLNREGISYHLYLCELSDFAVSDNIEYFSIQLLELDIREKLAEILKIERKETVNKNEFQLAFEYDKMISSCQDWSKDIFESLDKIESYLKAHLKEGVSETLLNLFESIPKKIQVIKSKNQLDEILSHLISLPLICQDGKVKRLAEELICELKNTVNYE